MVREELIGLNDPSRWAAVLASLPHGWAHSWENCHAQHLTTGNPTFLYCAHNEQLTVACPIAERAIGEHVDITTPSGFSGFVGNGPWPGFPAHFGEFARRRGYVSAYIALNPLFGDESYVNEDEIFPNTEVYVLDITRGLQTLHGRLSRTRRRDLRDWSPGLHDLDRPRLTDFLLANYGAFMEARGAGQQYQLSARTLEAICTAPNVLLFGAESDGVVEAVRIIGYTAFGADDLFLVSTPGGARHSTALAWSAVHRLIGLGVPTYNLGGGVRPRDHVAQAKERLGPARLPFRGLKQVYDQDTFAKLCRRYGCSPTEDTGYFPPYRPRQGGTRGS